jgi:hypothetical protein
MLKVLDILIGLATVMLLFSIAVTALTHFVTSLAGSRGRNLKKGIAGLLQQLDPSVQRKLADEIATAVLKHPLIADPLGRVGSAIHREELTTLLMEFAAGQTPTALPADAKAALIALLKKNGLSDPGQTLGNIRDLALQLEASNPELANHVRYSLATVQEASSQFITKVHGWFDQTIDRVSVRFTSSARVITFVMALVVAVLVQLDVIALINRLSVDEAFRKAVDTSSQRLVEHAVPGLNGQNNAQPVQPSSQPQSYGTGQAAGGTNSSQSTEDRTNVQGEYYDLLSTAGMISMPWDGWRDWCDRWSVRPGQRVIGVLLSALLLSMGATFWYKTLANLLRLRSVLTQRDDEQRSERQTQTTAGAGGAATPALPEILQGEQGDLNAVG